MTFKYTSVITNVCTSYDNADGSMFYIWEPEVSFLSKKEIDAYEKTHYSKNAMMGNEKKITFQNKEENYARLKPL